MRAAFGFFGRGALVFFPRGGCGFFAGAGRGFFVGGGCGFFGGGCGFFGGRCGFFVGETFAFLVAVKVRGIGHFLHRERVVVMIFRNDELGSNLCDPDDVGRGLGWIGRVTMVVNNVDAGNGTVVFGGAVSDVHAAPRLLRILAGFVHPGDVDVLVARGPGIV